MSLPRVFTAPLHDQFNEQGYAVVPALFAGDECDAIAVAASDRVWPNRSTALQRWVDDRRWAEIAVGLLGPDPRFLREQVLTKWPRGGATVPWHQDHGYAPIVPPFVTCFVALDDISRANGCLWVLPRSHDGGPVDHEPDGAILRIRDDPRTDAVPIELDRGDTLVMSSLTHHRSGPNDSDGFRPAWLVQFCATAATAAPTER